MAIASLAVVVPSPIRYFTRRWAISHAVANADQHGLYHHALREKSTHRCRHRRQCYIREVPLMSHPEMSEKVAHA